MDKKSRIDQILVSRGYFQFCADAQKAILAGFVKVASQGVKKSNQMFDPQAPIEILQRKRYVSRGGEKLHGALEYFQIDVTGKVVLDIGSSTGGFTDCVLQHEACKVYALDVGYGQLDSRLRQDLRVIMREKTNARYLKPDDFPEKMDLVVVDVSFISLKCILPVIPPLLRKEGEVVSLVKPQFEVGKGKVGKGGVVRDERLRLETVELIKKFAQDIGFEVKGMCPSPLKGPAGNVEYLLYLQLP